jgi:hypothetical protein
MQTTTLNPLDTGTGTVGPLFEQTPYRPARIMSGVRCTGMLDDGTPCESPLTTRMRSGVDVDGRPLGEYLCETCGTVFVAVTAGLDVRIRFDEVADDPDRVIRPAVSIIQALRRTERKPPAERVSPLKSKLALLEVCPECGNIVHQDQLEAHARVHAED